MTLETLCEITLRLAAEGRRQREDQEQEIVVEATVLEARQDDDPAEKSILLV